MRVMHALACLLGAVALAGTAAADAPGAGAPAQTIEARQAAFALSGPTFGALRAGLAAETDVTTLVGGARALSRWARVMPGLFPAGTDGAPSRAKPEIWADRAGFDAAAADYQRAVDRLLAAAQAGDQPGFAAAWEATRQTCATCHDKYRQPNR